MSMNGPDLTKMPPQLTAVIIVALIIAAWAMEAVKSPNTLTIIIALVGVIGLQQARTSQATSRIEHQTNGGLISRLESMIAPVMEALNQIKQRLDRGDRKFDELSGENAELRRQVGQLQHQVDQLANCEVKTTDGEGE